MKKKRPKKASSLSVEYLSQNVILTHHLLMDELRSIRRQVATLRVELSAIREMVKLRGFKALERRASPVSSVNTEGEPT